LVVFAIILFFAVDVIGRPYTTVAFLIGGLTSILSGYIGMRVAVFSNVRTTKECAQDINLGFRVAYRGG
jgi:inorganic pyrophosphatase